MRDSVGIAIPLFAALVVVCLIVYGLQKDDARHLSRIIHHLRKDIAMSTQEAINTITAQLGKAKDEIVAKIADVQAQLDAASVPPETVDLSALTAAAQALDDVVPDAPVETPVEDIAVPLGEGDPTA